ncbi:hypothetical protein Tco_1452110 [Tanacetum coccineum]
MLKTVQLVFAEDTSASVLQFSLVDNSKLNDVNFLLRRLKQNVLLLKGLQGGKRLLYVKRNKAISLGMNTSKVGIEVQQLSSKDFLERILEQDIEKMVDDDDDSEATEFDGSEYFNDGEDSGTRLEPGRHKKNSEEVDNDDDDMKEKKDDKKDVDDDDDGNDDDDHTDHASIKDQVSGSQQLRIEKMQTPIPLPPRSLRIDLSSDKDITQELMGIVSPIPITS